MKIQNNITHVALVLDKSSSMSSYSSQLIKVVDNQIAYLARKSQEENHEVRVSVYLFGSDVEVLVYDRDVLRLPSISQYYKAHGNTCLIDGLTEAITDLRKIPEVHATHNWLVFCFSDGEENCSRKSTASLKDLIGSLPDNYTIAAFAPGVNAIAECKKYGIPPNNIQVWDVSAKGVEEVGKVIRQSTDNLIAAHKTGVRSTKNLFSLNTAAVSKNVITSQLEPLNPKEYTILQVRKDTPIKEFVESWKISFTQGANYYQLTKPEKIQANKHICIRDKKNGKVYSGDNARSLLGLPDFEVKVDKATHKDFDILIQSNSNNRKLIAGTDLLVML